MVKMILMNSVFLLIFFKTKEVLIMRKILLSSTGFSNKNLEKIFLDNLEKPVNEVRALFIPTAAIDEEAKSILPFCRQDLTDAGVLEENIVTYDLEQPMDANDLAKYDAVYFCGGSPEHLMEAIHRVDFAQPLLEAVEKGLFYIGVSAGSMIATPSVENNLGIIPNPLEPHCEENITPVGVLPKPGSPVNISDDQAVWIHGDIARIIE